MTFGRNPTISLRESGEAINHEGHTAGSAVAMVIACGASKEEVINRRPLIQPRKRKPFQSALALWPPEALPYLK